MENVLIIGSHGKVGKKLVRLLVAAGYNVYAMIRHKVQYTDMENMGAIPVVADLENDFSFAFANIDIVIFTAGSGSHTGPDKTILVDQEGAVKSIEFADRYGVKRFIMVSAQGARTPNEPSKIQHYYKAKAIADEHLAKSKLNYTIFRPGKLTDEPGTEKINIAKIIRHKGTTSRDNLASAIQKSINLTSSYYKTFDILDGDEDLETAIAGL